ncbi:glutamine synthetase family protein [Yoonia litorea]|uniref:Glutamine synthetase n=1 Tax=Yoonia litorea TaxID=1123755 RepID=A0A1I6MH44_9RHOB|nr:glutamine synthetase family protein [Yoonia litorea]SFS14972.1 glutamine synthetase [Yoonia litorea]
MSWMDEIPEAARTYLEVNRLDEVECVIADLPGIARGKAVPAGKWDKQNYFHLPNSIFFQTITGDWGEAAGPEGFLEPDMILKPDYSTATAAPWANDGTLQVIHDAYDQKGRPVPFAPRNVLKRVVDLYAKQGWTPIVAPEMEFYLVGRNIDPAKPIAPMMGRTGRPAAGRQAYSMSAVDDYGPVIDDIYEFAEIQGFEIDGIAQEGGAGQLEINLRHGDPVKLADEVFYFKRLIREAALRHDCFATFMAKPIEGEPGSAMHVHHSVTDTDGRNVFTGPQNGETDAFFHFIGGLQEHLPSAMALMAPYVNSYRRYVPGEAAPVNLEWGRDNRTTGIRIPISSPAARRVENRLPGMDCNPYLCIAASLACGYLGMMNEIRPDKRWRGEASDSEAEVAESLWTALDQFDEATELHKVLGTDFARVYSIVKRAEYTEFLQVISPWEREHLLLNV